MTFPAPASGVGAGVRTSVELWELFGFATGGEGGCSVGSSADGSWLLVNIVALELIVPKTRASAT